MSWHKIAKLKLTDDEITSILNTIGANHILGGKAIKNTWGWSAECDITNNIDHIVFSGADYSKASNLLDRFKKETRKRGFYKNITVI